MIVRVFTTALGLALFAIPAPASQPTDVRMKSLAPDLRLTAMQSEIGFSLDPHPVPSFHIELPTSIGELAFAI